MRTIVGILAPPTLGHHRSFPHKLRMPHLKRKTSIVALKVGVRQATVDADTSQNSCCKNCRVGCQRRRRENLFCQRLNCIGLSAPLKATLKRSNSKQGTDSYSDFFQGVSTPCLYVQVQQNRNGFLPTSRTGPVYAATAKGCRKAASCRIATGGGRRFSKLYCSGVLARIRFKPGCKNVRVYWLFA
jgi:hypothetical protein